MKIEHKEKEAGAHHSPKVVSHCIGKALCVMETYMLYTKTLSAFETRYIQGGFLIGLALASISHTRPPTLAALSMKILQPSTRTIT